MRGPFALNTPKVDWIGRRNFEMNKVTMDETLRAHLKGATASLEFTDESGNTVGHFLTDAEYKRLLHDIAVAPVPREEIAEARAEMRAGGGVGTSAILQAIDDAQREWEARQ